jgi:hypothetical protein
MKFWFKDISPGGESWQNLSMQAACSRDEVEKKRDFI